MTLAPIWWVHFRTSGDDSRFFALLAKTATLKAEVEKKHSGKWNDDKKLRRQKTRRNKESWKTFLFFISFSLVFCLSWTSFAISVLEEKKTLGRISIVPNLLQILSLPGRCSSVARVSFKGPSLVQLCVGSNHAAFQGGGQNSTSAICCWNESSVRE